MASSSRRQYIPRPLRTGELRQIPLRKDAQPSPAETDRYHREWGDVLRLEQQARSVVVEDTKRYHREWPNVFKPTPTSYDIGAVAVPAVTAGLQGELFPRMRWPKKHERRVHNEKPINHGTVPFVAGVVEVTNTGGSTRFLRRETRVMEAGIHGSQSRKAREGAMNVLFEGDSPTYEDFFSPQDPKKAYVSAEAHGTAPSRPSTILRMYLPPKEDVKQKPEKNNDTDLVSKWFPPEPDQETQQRAQEEWEVALAADFPHEAPELPLSFEGQEQNGYWKEIVNFSLGTAAVRLAS